MPTEQNRLYLYEALELRAEYDARIKTFRDCLPETRRNRDQLGMYRNDEQQLGTLVPHTLAWYPPNLPWYPVNHHNTDNFSLLRELRDCPQVMYTVQAAKRGAGA